MNKFRSALLIIAIMTAAGCSKRASAPADASLQQLQRQKEVADRKADEALRQQAIDEANREGAAWQSIAPEERAQIEKQRQTMERHQNEGNKDTLP